jgi:hypothetical protein
LTPIIEGRMILVGFLVTLWLKIFGAFKKDLIYNIIELKAHSGREKLMKWDMGEMASW